MRTATAPCCTISIATGEEGDAAHVAFRTLKTCLLRWALRTLKTLLLVAAGAREQAIYVDGPHVSNSAHVQGSCTCAGSLSEARAHCDPYRGCQVLHDFDCDGRGWRRCGRDIGMFVSAGNGTAACTRVVSTAPSTHWTCSAIADPTAHRIGVRQQREWDQGHTGCATLPPPQDVTQANVDELSGVRCHTLVPAASSLCARV